MAAPIRSEGAGTSPGSSPIFGRDEPIFGRLT